MREPWDSEQGLLLEIPRPTRDKGICNSDTWTSAITPGRVLAVRSHAYTQAGLMARGGFWALLGLTWLQLLFHGNPDFTLRLGSHVPYNAQSRAQQAASLPCFNSGARGFGPWPSFKKSVGRFLLEDDTPIRVVESLPEPPNRDLTYTRSVRASTSPRSSCICVVWGCIRSSSSIRVAKGAVGDSGFK